MEERKEEEEEESKSVYYVPHGLVRHVEGGGGVSRVFVEAALQAIPPR